MKYFAKSCCILPMLLCAAGATQAQEGSVDTLTEMATKGSANLDFRYRYENVDDDSKHRTASANTLRSRLTLASASWSGFSGLAEVDNVWDFGSDNYNSTENGNTQYPVIADPEGTDLNQVWLKYAGDSYDGTAGRQCILHGNQRFVGGVAWRQNEQTYDGFRAHWDPIEKLKLDLSYVYSVNRIFGPDDGANPAELEGDNFFFRTDYQLLENHKVAAFGYYQLYCFVCLLAGEFVLDRGGDVDGVGSVLFVYGFTLADTGFGDSILQGQKYRFVYRGSDIVCRS